MRAGKMDEWHNSGICSLTQRVNIRQLMHGPRQRTRLLVGSKNRRKLGRAPRVGADGRNPGHDAGSATDKDTGWWMQWSRPCRNG